jgi:hypothetical protein
VLAGRKVGFELGRVRCDGHGLVGLHGEWGAGCEGVGELSGEGGEGGRV